MSQCQAHVTRGIEFARGQHARLLAMGYTSAEAYSIIREAGPGQIEDVLYLADRVRKQMAGFKPEMRVIIRDALLDRVQDSLDCLPAENAHFLQHYGVFKALFGELPSTMLYSTERRLHQIGNGLWQLLTVELKGRGVIFPRR